jgi:glycosyltransferase involved in cell wall biosynthesis
MYRVPLLLVFQDILGLAAVESGVEGGRRVGGTVARCELALARRADRVGVIAPAFRDYFEARQIPRSKIALLRNWVLTEASDAPMLSREDFGWPSDAFVCLHAGNMGHKQGLDNVLSAAELAGDRPFLFVLAGDGSQRPALERAANERRLANVRFLSPQPTARFNAMLKLADVLLVNQRSSVGEMSLPSKLASYFHAGRPVLAAVSGASAAAREVDRAGAGIVVEADSPAAMVRALDELRSDSMLRTRLSDRGRAYAHSHLSHAAAVEEYAAVVDEMVGAAARASRLPRGASA